MEKIFVGFTPDFQNNYTHPTAEQKRCANNYIKYQMNKLGYLLQMKYYM